MKSANLILSTLLFSTLLFVRCTPSQDLVPSTREIITQGNWVVEHFDNGQNLTSNYSNYQFRFNTNGRISCLHSGGACEGMWNVDPNEVLQIQLHSQEATVQQLVKDWKVVSADLNTVNLQLNTTHLRLRKL